MFANTQQHLLSHGEGLLHACIPTITPNYSLRHRQRVIPPYIPLDFTFDLKNYTPAYRSTRYNILVIDFSLGLLHKNLPLGNKMKYFIPWDNFLWKTTRCRSITDK